MKLQRWFWGLTGAMLYLTGMNDEAFGHLGDWWLTLPSGLQVGLVAALVVLALLIGVRLLRARRGAHAAALRAVDGVARDPRVARDPQVPQIPRDPQGPRDPRVPQIPRERSVA